MNPLVRESNPFVFSEKGNEVWDYLVKTMGPVIGTLMTEYDVDRISVVGMLSETASYLVAVKSLEESVQRRKKHTSNFWG